MTDADREQLRQLLLERSVRFGDFTLASGRRSSVYIDCRPSTMSAQGLNLIGRMGWQAIRARSWRPNLVGGLTMGADPVAYAIAAASWGSDLVVDGFSVRKEAKEHGTGRVIEGNFTAGQAVVVIEDVITSGGSAQKAIDAIETGGGQVLGVLAVVDRDEGGKGALEARGREVVALITSRELGLDRS
jgi:orotate phosphoribosyltransferase